MRIEHRHLNPFSVLEVLGRLEQYEAVRMSAENGYLPVQIDDTVSAAGLIEVGKPLGRHLEKPLSANINSLLLKHLGLSAGGCQ